MELGEIRDLKVDGERSDESVKRLWSCGETRAAALPHFDLRRREHVEMRRLYCA